MVIKMDGKIPLLGEKFPEIEILTMHGKMKLPDDFKGKWFPIIDRIANILWLIHPNNEIVGSDIIILLQVRNKLRKELKKQELGEIKCYDW